MRGRGRVGAGARCAAAVLVVLLCATSCRDVETVVEVHGDETATVSFLVVPGLRNLEQLGGEKSFDRLVRQFDNPDGGISAEKVAEAGGTGMKVTVEAKALSELSRPYVLPAPPAPPGSTLQLFDSFVLLHRNGTWRLDAVARPVTQLAAGLPVLGGDLGEATYEVKVKLPGKVESSNGTESDGGVSWTLSGTEPAQLEMRTADRGPVSPLLLVVGGAVLLILVGLLFAARGKDAVTATNIHKESKRFLRRRKETEGSWQEAAARTALPPGAAASAATEAAAPPAVLYADDYEGDESLALPVPGAGWGPAPPPGTTTTGTVRPAPRPVEPSGDGAAAMGPSTPVVALDRGNRLGVAKEDSADAAPATPPGWYADPEDPSRQRFWDGAAWTEHRG